MHRSSSSGQLNSRPTSPAPDLAKTSSAGSSSGGEPLPQVPQLSAEQYRAVLSSVFDKPQNTEMTTLNNAPASDAPTQLVEVPLSANTGASSDTGLFKTQGNHPSSNTTNDTQAVVSPPKTGWRRFICCGS